MNDNFLQRRCPECGRKAYKVEKGYPSERTCPIGHKWIPIKNPDPVPPEPKDEE